MREPCVSYYALYYQPTVGDEIDVPNEAYKIKRYVEAHNGTPPKGYKGGKAYKNEPRGDAQKLPTTTTYKEYDIYPKIDGIKRGTERIVLGADGSAWYTVTIILVL